MKYYTCTSQACNMENWFHDLFYVQKHFPKQLILIVIATKLITDLINQIQINNDYNEVVSIPLAFLIKTSKTKDYGSMIKAIALHGDFKQPI